jgi:hypothetical protein
MATTKTTLDANCAKGLFLEYKVRNKSLSMILDAA